MIPQKSYERTIKPPTSHFAPSSAAYQSRVTEPEDMPVHYILIQPPNDGTTTTTKTDYDGRRLDMAKKGTVYSVQHIYGNGIR